MRALKREFAGVDLHDPSRVGRESRIFGETPVLTVVKLLGVVEEGGPRQLLDLGSGRGTVVLAAAACGFTALGLELEEDWVARAQRVAKRLGLPAEFRCADFLEGDWPEAAVVFVVATAFPEEVRAEILDRVRRLQPGSYLIAGDWPDLHSLDLVWQGPLPVEWGVIPFSVYRIGAHTL